MKELTEEDAPWISGRDTVELAWTFPARTRIEGFLVRGDAGGAVLCSIQSGSVEALGSEILVSDLHRRSVAISIPILEAGCRLALKVAGSEGRDFEIRPVGVMAS